MEQRNTTRAQTQPTSPIIVDNSLLFPPASVFNSPKHILSILLIIINILSFSLFSNIAKADPIRKKIAITQIVEHPSLDQARKGILDVLKENGYHDGKNIDILYQNAQGSIANTVSIAKKLVAMKPDAIIPISTPSAQAVVNAAKNTDIPIVFSSVTDPVSAGLVKNLDNPTMNITGSMDFPLIKEEITLIKTLMPKVKTIGLLYSSGESNSVKTVNLMKVEIKKNNLDYIESVAVNSHQISQAFSALVGKADVIYIPSDNVVYSAMPKLVQLEKIHQLPIFSSDPDSIKQGIVACIGYTQYAVGRKTGELLVKVLKGNRKLLIEKPQTTEIFINQPSANKLNIIIPEKIMGIKPNIINN